MPRISERQTILTALDKLIFQLIIGKKNKDKIKKLVLFRIGVESERFISQRDRIPKQFGMREILLLYNDNDFRQITRMTRETFNELYLVIGNDDIFRNNSRNQQMDVKYQIIVGLERLGCSGNGASVGRFARSNGVSNGAVTLLAKRFITGMILFITAVINNINNIIWPNRDNRKRISQRIHDKYGLPNAVGIIDGTSIVLYQVN